MNVTIKGIRLMDFPPSPTGAYQLAKIDFSIEGVMTMKSAGAGLRPSRPRDWRVERRPSARSKPSVASTRTVARSRPTSPASRNCRLRLPWCGRLRRGGPDAVRDQELVKALAT